MFVILGALFALFSIKQGINNKESENFLFYFSIILLTLMLSFRYGQMTDYHEYEVQYASVSVLGELLVNTLYHGELGWYMVLFIARKIGLSFSAFIVLLSIIMMASVYRTIKTYSPLKLISILLLYPTLYLTYFYSAIRQGIVISLFLAFGLEFLLNRNYGRYFILCGVLFFIHTSALILFFIPVLVYLSGKYPQRLIIIAAIMSVVLGYSGLLNIVAVRIGIHSFNISISIGAILIRLIYLYFVFVNHSQIEGMQGIIQDNQRELEEKMYKIYMLGGILFLMLSFNGILSQRLTVPIKAVEVVLMPLQYYIIKMSGNRYGTWSLAKIHFGSNRYIYLSLLMIIAIAFVELIKNMYSYIDQGNYYDFVNPLNFPYISIFNKENIFNYITHFD